MIDDFDKLSVTELRLRGMTSDKILAEQKRRGMSKQQINDAWFPKPPTYNRIGSRRFRRRLVLATYGGWLLVAAIVVLASMTYPGSIFACYEYLPFLFVANAGRRWSGSCAEPTSAAKCSRRMPGSTNVWSRTETMLSAEPFKSSLRWSCWPGRCLLAAMWLRSPANQGLTNALVIYFAVGPARRQRCQPRSGRGASRPDPEPLGS